MLLIESREYKVMLDHRAFFDRETAVSAFWAETAEFARSCGVSPEGELEETKQRSIVFLDTRNFTLNDNGFILRRRGKAGADKVEYTLKWRSDDRYVAAAADVRKGDVGSDEELKFEEDIAAPFRSRYSRSNSIKVKADRQTPSTLGAAAKLFPALGTLQRDLLPCQPETPLLAVNNVHAFERVFAGPVLTFGQAKATVALIFWSDGDEGRPLVAEFSFRYAAAEEEFPAAVAESAMKFFQSIQRLDWCRPTAMTKTEYVYRTAAAD